MYEAPQVCGIVEDAVAVTLQVEWVSENWNGRSNQLAEIAVTHLGGRDCPLSKLARTAPANAFIVSKEEKFVLDDWRHPLPPRKYCAVRRVSLQSPLGC